MSDKHDKISLKEAAGLFDRDAFMGIYRNGRPVAGDAVTPEDEADRLKRERETGEATAVLEVMLAAGRAGKKVVQ